MFPVLMLATVATTEAPNFSYIALDAAIRRADYYCGGVIVAYQPKGKNTMMAHCRNGERYEVDFGERPSEIKVTPRP